MLDYLRQQIGVSEDLSLAALARVARLSPSRLMHVFTVSVGVPIRPYVLWLRIQVASSELVRGARVAPSPPLNDEAPILQREVCGADASGTFNRADFGVDSGVQYGFRQEVTLRIQVEAVRLD
ncbi:MAG TPA: hypothetical protein VNW26_00580 [Steroidobacteraceae bacterium]|nr:hypothetical protein [Steroidobacteraceae bacterium]